MLFEERESKQLVWSLVASALMEISADLCFRAWVSWPPPAGQHGQGGILLSKLPKPKLFSWMGFSSLPVLTVESFVCVCTVRPESQLGPSYQKKGSFSPWNEVFSKKHSLWGDFMEAALCLRAKPAAAHWNASKGCWGSCCWATHGGEPQASGAGAILWSSLSPLAPPLADVVLA